MEPKICKIIAILLTLDIQDLENFIKRSRKMTKRRNNAFVVIYGDLRKFFDASQT